MSLPISSPYMPSWAKRYNIIFIPVNSECCVEKMPFRDRFLFQFQGAYGTIHTYVPHDPQPSVAISKEEMASIISQVEGITAGQGDANEQG